MYSGELEIKKNGKVTKLHKGDCAFIRKDFCVQMTKQGYENEQFKAVFLMFTNKFLREFYSRLDKEKLPKDASRDGSVYTGCLLIARILLVCLNQ